MTAEESERRARLMSVCARRSEWSEERCAGRPAPDAGPDSDEAMSIMQEANTYDRPLLELLRLAYGAHYSSDRQLLKESSA
jgi:hypothetical protein